MEYYNIVINFFYNNPIYAYFAYMGVVCLILLSTRLGD